MDEISKRYEKIIFCAPVKKDEYTDNLYEICSSNIEYQVLPPVHSFISALKRRSAVLSAIKQFARTWDCPVYLRWPTPFVYDVYKMAKKKNLPLILHIVGDSKTIINSSGKYTGAIRLVANSYVNILESQVKMIMKDTPTLINGSGLKRLYEDENVLYVKEIRSATLSIGEFDDEHIHRNHAKKLLYVGVLKNEKGIPYLLQAVKLLIDNHIEVTLTIVGDGPERTVLEKFSRELGLSHNVIFTGYIPLGKELINIYKQNDIFVLPSVSEGTPRVILEAMANKLAVVATNVGGIPYTISNYENGIMVTSKSATELEIAIEKLINDNELRNKLIANGYVFAKENTIEKFIDIVCETIDGQAKL